MPGAAATAETFGNAGHANDGLLGLAVRIHLFDARRKEQVAAGFEQLVLIRSEGARVVVQVFVGAELQWIDEDAGDHEVGALPGLLHQRDVAGVQVAHCRYEADALAFPTGAGHCGTQVGDGLDDVHAEKPCSTAGNSVALTAFT